MTLVTNFAPAEDLTFSQLAPGEATATLPTTEWSSISGLRAGYRIITDEGTVNEGEAYLLSDPEFQSLSISILIIKPISNLTITSGNWGLFVPQTKSIVDYLPRHVKRTLVIPEYLQSLQEITVDPINDAVQRLRNLRRWNVMDSEYLDVFLQTLGLFFKSEQFDTETRRRFIKELPAFLELSGTESGLNYLSFVLGALLTIEHLWSNDYKNFIIRSEIPGGDETGWYPTNHVQLTFDGTVFGSIDIDIIVDTFYVLASLPLVLQRVNQLLNLPEIEVQSPSLITITEYSTFTDTTP